MLEQVGYPARRQGVNGLHVHVGVESAERCHERFEAVLSWLPVVLAMSANSPYVDGLANGMLSNRAGVLAELPRGGPPPAFGAYEGLLLGAQHVHRAKENHRVVEVGEARHHHVDRRSMDSRCVRTLARQEFFESFHLLAKPVYASIYWPGTALMNAPGVWLGAGTWAPPRRWCLHDGIGGHRR